MKRTLSLCIVGTLVLLATMLSQSTVSAQPIFLTVNSPKDNIQNGCDATHCTLREAILQSNMTVGAKETIQFNIDPVSNFLYCNTTSKVCTILLTSALPAITDPVSIDGYTQPDASPNTLAVGIDAQLRIVLHGQSLNIDGLVVQDTDTQIQGLALVHFRKAIILKADHARVTGNFIGMLPEGELVGANDTGVSVFNGSDNDIGGEPPRFRNLISGNHNGIFIDHSVRTHVQGNYIGTDASGGKTSGGTADTGNAQGITSVESTFTTIGGTNVNARNVIAANSGWGIHFGNNTVAGFVLGNFIGVGADGKVVLGNNIGIGVFGAHIENVQITNNRIRFNQLYGVQIGGNNINHVALHENQFLNNGGLAIDLHADHVTANDLNDTDNGENGLQNFPVLTKVKPDSGGTTIKGKLNSTPNHTFLIEVYINKFCDPRGHGEGAGFVDSVQVTTNATGNVNFNFHSNKILLAGQAATATASRIDGNLQSTSEFSQCRVVE